MLEGKDRERALTIIEKTDDDTDVDEDNAVLYKAILAALEREFYVFRIPGSECSDELVANYLRAHRNYLILSICIWAAIVGAIAHAAYTLYSALC